MQRLQARIESLRQRNIEFRYFVPSQELYTTLDEASVQEVIKGCDIEPYNRKEYVETILRGGRKVFAILVLMGLPHLIEEFIKKDQLQHDQLDNRLPYSETDLELRIPDTAQRFFEMQWELLAPLFSTLKTHRVLDDHSILPFTNETYIASGGFGEVHEVWLYGPHQRLVETSDKVVKVVRKRMRECTSIEDFENELRVLSYLRCLEHPNILQLLGSYTHRNKHSLIFPLAGENIEQLMARTEAPPELTSDFSFLKSVADLASALEKVHTFMSEDLDVKFIGCHFDIKPTNILVIEGKLILADFGIARLKKETPDSRTIFKGGGGHYLAPECQNVVDGFRKHSVGRSSDIWSFGCVLLELLTFKQYGAIKLKHFRERRESVGAYGFKTRTFYLGYDLHPEVDMWLKTLNSDLNEDMKRLLYLIKRMLDPQNMSRPLAKEVTSQLRITTLGSAFRSTRGAMLELCARDRHPELVIETLRFKVWGQVVGLVESSHEQNTFLTHLATHSFDVTLDLMARVKKEVQEIMLALSIEGSSYAVFSPLRTLNEKLEYLLPSAMISQTRSLLEHQILSTTDQLSLQDVQEIGSLSSHYIDLSLLAAIKRMTTLSQSDEHDDPSLRVDIASVHNTEGLDSHRIGTVKAGDGTAHAKTLTEWIEYDAHWSEEKAGSLLFSRVTAVVKLHQSASRSSKMRTLHSRGYYHDPARHAFGVLYDFPPSALVWPNWKPYTLARIVETLNATPWSRPSLEDRHRLAYRLATALAEIHKVNWLHKSLSANSVIFFGPDNEGSPPSSSTLFDDPFFIGFAHSRPGDRVAFSEGPRADTEDWYIRQEYQHPRYRQRSARYRIEYDYYGLGIVLLELGLWRSISPKLKLATRKSPGEKQTHLLEEWVPQLSFYMGSAYEEVVRYCLQVADHNIAEEEKAEEEEEEEERESLSMTDVRLSFETSVVQVLSQWPIQETAVNSGKAQAERTAQSERNVDIQGSQE